MARTAGNSANRRTGAYTPGRRGGTVCLAAAVAVWVVWSGDGASGAWAQTADGAGGAEASTSDVREVVDRLRMVIIALASAIGTLFLTIAGLRWMLAGGDPGQVDGAKRALTGAAIGYGIAVLATVLMAILDYVVTGTAGDGQ